MTQPAAALTYIHQDGRVKADTALCQDGENYLRYKVASCLVYSAADQSISDATLTALLFDTEAYDNNSMHSTGSNTSRLVAPIDGIYIASGGVTLEVGTAGIFCLLRIVRSDGVAVGEMRQIASGVADVITVTSVLPLTAGQYVEFFVYHDSTGSRTSKGFTALTPVVMPFGSLTYIGE